MSNLLKVDFPLPVSSFSSAKHREASELLDRADSLRQYPGGRLPADNCRGSSQKARSCLSPTRPMYVPSSVNSEAAPLQSRSSAIRLGGVAGVAGVRRGCDDLAFVKRQKSRLWNCSDEVFNQSRCTHIGFAMIHPNWLRILP